MIEVHNNPACAKCDGMQSLTMPEFGTLMKKINIIKEAQTAVAAM
jgi:3-deoxy-7-phosphoheptulonate synthase